MEATTRTVPLLLPTPPGKRAKTEEIAPINKLPADIFRLIFGYCTPREILLHTRVCQRWKTVLSSGDTLKLLIPKVSCTVFGKRFFCKELVNLINRYISDLPTLDLTYMNLHNSADLSRLQPVIHNLVLKNCVIEDPQITVLISKMAKKEATLKIKTKTIMTISLTVVFDTLRMNKIQLKKLTITDWGLHLNSNRDAFIEFVNEGGLQQESCQMSLWISGFDPSILTCFNKNKIQFTKLELHMISLNFGNVIEPRAEEKYHHTLAACIHEGLLAPECDFRHIIGGNTDGSRKVNEALLKNSIRLKHFSGFPRRPYLTYDLSYDPTQREPFFQPISGPNSTSSCRGLTSKCSLSLKPDDLMALTPTIVTSTHTITKLIVGSSYRDYDRLDFTQNLCHLITFGRLEDRYTLILRSDMLDNRILVALTNRPVRMDHFELFNGNHRNYAHEPRLRVNGPFFRAFLLALSRRQSSIEAFILDSQRDSNGLLNQRAIDTFAEMGRQKFKFRRLQLKRNEWDDLKEINLLPLVQSGALSDCMDFKCNLPIDHLIETLQALTQTAVRILHLRIVPSQRAVAEAFFKTHRFPFLIDLEIRIKERWQHGNGEVDETISKQYFERT